MRTNIECLDSTRTLQTEVFIFHSLHIWTNLSGARTSHFNITGIFFYDMTLLLGQGLLVIEASRSHSVRHATFGRTLLDE